MLSAAISVAFSGGLAALAQLPIWAHRIRVSLRRLDFDRAILEMVSLIV